MSIRIILKNGTVIESDKFEKEMIEVLKLNGTGNKQLLVGNGNICKVCGSELTGKKRTLCGSEKCEKKLQVAYSRQWYQNKMKRMKAVEAVVPENVPVHTA